MRKTAPPPHPGGLLLRGLLALSATLVVFVDGLGRFLAPGQVLASAFSVHPHGSDPRWGVVLGLAFWAGLAMLSVAVRTRSSLERRR